MTTRAPAITKSLPELSVIPPRVTVPEKTGETTLIPEAKGEQGRLTDEGAEGYRHQHRVEKPLEHGPLNHSQMEKHAKYCHAEQSRQNCHGIGKAQNGQNPVGDEGPEHVEFTLSEVEHLDNTENKREAGGHERVHAAAHQAVDHELYEQTPDSSGSPLRQEQFTA